MFAKNAKLYFCIIGFTITHMNSKDCDMKMIDIVTYLPDYAVHKMRPMEIQYAECNKTNNIQNCALT